MEEYRDIHGTKDSLEGYKKKIQASDMSDKQKKKIAQFIEDLAIGKIGKKVKVRRIASYLQFLVKLHEYYKKDLDKINEKEATQFYKDLEDNKIMRDNKQPFSPATKDLFIRTLKRYLGYCWGKEEKYKKIIGWQKEGYKKSDKQAIELEQAREIVSKEKYIRNKCLFMFAFDTGGRIEEILNVRLKDLIKSGKKNEYYMVHLRGTKTELSDRKIALTLSNKELTDWLKEYDTAKPEDFLFPINYDNARKIIREMSLRVLKEGLAPHELRHSSATYFIQKFGAANLGGFYYRFGWKFGSKEANTYIKEFLFSGELAQEKVVKLVENDRIEALEKQNEELWEKMKQIDKDIKLLLEMKNKAR